MDIGAIGNAAFKAQASADTRQSAPVATSAPATAPAPGSAPAPSLDQVKQAVQDINKSLQSKPEAPEFSIDADTKQIVVKLIDPQTKEVIHQMPTQQALEIAKALDQVLGKLIKERA